MFSCKILVNAQKKKSNLPCLRNVLVHVFSDCRFFTFLTFGGEGKQDSTVLPQCFFRLLQRDNTELSRSVFYLIPCGMSNILSETLPTISTEKLFKNWKWKIWDRKASVTEGAERKSKFYLYTQNEEKSGFWMYRSKIYLYLLQASMALCAVG